jgi:hypothetical protein
MRLILGFSRAVFCSSINGAEVDQVASFQIYPSLSMPFVLGPGTPSSFLAHCFVSLPHADEKRNFEVKRDIRALGQSIFCIFDESLTLYLLSF